MNSRLTVYEYIGLADLPGLWYAAAAGGRIFYVNASPAACKILSSFGPLFRAERYSYIFGALKSPSGEGYFGQLRRDKDLLSACIEQQFIIPSVSVNMLNRTLRTTLVTDFFRRVCHAELDPLLVLVLACRHLQNSMPQPAEITVRAWLGPRVFRGVIQQFMREQYAVTVEPDGRFRHALQTVYRCSRSFLKAIVTIVKPACAFWKHMKLQRQFGGKSCIGTLYTLRGMTFEKDKRSDFPWMIDSAIDPHDVVLYFDRSDMPVTDDMYRTLSSRGVRPIAMTARATRSKLIPVFSAGPLALKWCLLSGTMLAAALVREACTGARVVGGFLSETVFFLIEHALTLDFMKTCRIAVNVDFADHTPSKVARHIALSNIGSVSVGYQVSNWPFHSMFLGSAADVFFMFGPHYLDIFRASGGKSAAVVMAGFPSDYAFAAVREKARAVRSALAERGANFVIAYFDENSSNAPESLIPNRRSAQVYEALFDLVLTDPRVALLCSPKRPVNLFARIPEVQDKAAAAVATGRCRILGGSYTGTAYPCETALASDVSITLLLGGTTFLENQLAGVRTVSLDLEGLHDYAEYQTGKGTILFDSIDSLLSSVDRFRSDPAGFDDFGNRRMDTTIDRKDPYRDGQAHVRMGSYVQALYESMLRGASRMEAIAEASRLYRARWGTASVVERNS